MRSVDVSIVTKNIKEMCIQANHFLSEDMDIAMKNAVETEKAPLGKQILTQLQENLKIAGEDMIPICQDTGMGKRTDFLRYPSTYPWRTPSLMASVRLPPSKCTS